MTDTSSRQFGQIIKTLRTKSAVNPALIFALICMSGGITGIVVANETLAPLFAGIIALGVIVPALQILFFTIFDRNRLHDEKHVENRMLIEAMAPMLGDSKRVIVIDADPILKGNPALEEASDV